MEPLRQWLQQQHSRGIWIKFVRESALSKEPELIADIGIYGSRAVGMQELDDDCCTVRFTLTFHRARVTEAESRWTRLAVYAESFSDYLDRWGDAGLSGSNSTNMARLRLHRDRLSRRPSKGFAARLNCGMVQVWVAEPRPVGSGIQCRLGRNPLPNGRGSATHCVTELNHA